MNVRPSARASATAIAEPERARNVCFGSDVTCATGAVCDMSAVAIVPSSSIAVTTPLFSTACVTAREKPTDETAVGAVDATVQNVTRVPLDEIRKPFVDASCTTSG